MATIQLSDDDRRTIDLFLEQDSNAVISLDPSNNSNHSSSADEQRVQSVGRILNLLNHLPAVDPPATLAMETLRRIDADIAQKTQVGSDLEGTVYGLTPPTI